MWVQGRSLGYLSSIISSRRQSYKVSSRILPAIYSSISTGSTVSGSQVVHLIIYLSSGEKFSGLSLCGTYIGKVLSLHGIMVLLIVICREGKVDFFVIGVSIH